MNGPVVSHSAITPLLMVASVKRGRRFPLPLRVDRGVTSPASPVRGAERAGEREGRSSFIHSSGGGLNGRCESHHGNGRRRLRV